MKETREAKEREPGIEVAQQLLKMRSDAKKFQAVYVFFVKLQ